MGLDYFKKTNAMQLQEKNSKHACNAFDCLFIEHDKKENLFPTKMISNRSERCYVLHRKLIFILINTNLL